MPRKLKPPTPEQLAEYRSKAVSGQHIGKNQLAQVFMALDDAERRAAMSGSLVNELKSLVSILDRIDEKSAYEPQFDIFTRDAKTLIAKMAVL